MNATGTTRRAADPTLDATYQGWSGFILACGESSRPLLVFDPSPDEPLPNDAMVIAITHGHPEHVRGTRAHLRRPDRSAVTVIASRHVCRFLVRSSARRQDDRFLPADAGDELEADGWRIRVFGWRHMTLLPPGGFGAAVAHLARLFRHPIRLTQVALQALGGPRHAPMLGFHVRGEADNTDVSLVYFGEGLHRMTTTAELDAAFGEQDVDLLLTGVEPEDTDQIPDLLASRRIGRTVLFEPHRIWREQFGLPQINLPDLAARLQRHGHTVDMPAPGQRLQLVPARGSADRQ